MMNDAEIPIPKIEEVEQDLFKGRRGHEEARQIPIEYLEPSERALIEKYINYEQLEPHEEEKVKEIITRSRPALIKIRPDEVIENAEQNIQYIDDEKAFLNLVDEQDTIQVIPFTYHKAGKTYHMKFDLYPLEDSKAIEDVTKNLSMFKDLTQEELVTYNKMQHGEQLSREEILVRAKVDEKIRNAEIEHARTTTVEYLALQLKFHGKDSSRELMKKTFSRMSDAYLSLLFDEVQRRNHIGDLKAEKVFQSFD